VSDEARLSIPSDLVFDDAGLIPVVVQDRASGEVLMLAFANREALERTEATGFAHFWSRRRGTLWKKGETSGHTLRVQAALADCDRDTLLLLVDPHGPTCHHGTRTCFGDRTPIQVGVLSELADVIARRARERPEGSYTARLFEKGLDHALKKVGEEATEVVLAAKGESGERLAQEAADLLFHLLVVLAQRQVPLPQVLETLRERRRGG